jgi:DNA repair exonuclease SbcCD ATPase subunit
MSLKILKTDIKKFTHIVHAADIHIRLTKRHEEYLEVFENFYKQVRQTPPTTAICLLGDIVHSKIDLSPECVQLAKDFLYACADIRPTILIAGNHDANLTNRNRLDSLSPLVDAIKHPNLHYLRSSGLYALGNICFNNYSVFDDTAKYMKGVDIPKIYRNEYEYFIALFHGPVNNALTDLGYQITSKSYPIEMFDYHDIGLLGDIHMKQDLQYYDEKQDKPFVHYCGSLIQQNHGESIDKHGYSFWNLENREYSHVDIKNDYGYFTALINKGVIDTDLTNIPKKVRLRFQCFESVATEVKAALTKVRNLAEVIEVSYVRLDSPNDKARISPIGSKIILGDLTDKDYQAKLITDYLNKKLGVTDSGFINTVIEINNKTNMAVEKEEFARNIRWRPIRFEFDNMFSYGENNSIDFTKLKDVVGLFASNASGKSSILSALSFCIFDKCDREFKACNIMNVQKMSFKCKFEFEINGVRYFIARGGCADKKGNVKVNVMFWKEENGDQIDLNGEGRRDTNEVIREYLGTYDDFSLTALSVQSGKNVSSFIEMGHTDRKDLLAQFMGLTIFDRLYNNANERYKDLESLLKEYRNDEFTKLLVSCTNGLEQSQKVFNGETKSLSELSDRIVSIQSSILEETKKLIKIEGNIPPIAVSEQKKAKHEKNVTLLTNNIGELEKLHASLENETNTIEAEVKKMEEMDIASNFKQYQEFITKRNELQSTIEKKKVVVNHKLEKVSKASSYEYDPECEFCVKNNGEVVAEAAGAQKSLESDRIELLKFIEELNTVKENISKTEWSFSMNDTYTKLLENRNKVKDRLASKLADLNKFKEQLKDSKESVEKEEANIQLYNKNREDILLNESIESHIKDLNQKFSNTNTEIKKKNKTLLDLNGKMSVFKTQIEDIKIKIEKAKKIELEHKAYEAYVQCVSRDGIPYEVISVTVPEIEREVNNILSQIVEFHSHFEVDGKNVVPYVVYDDRKWVMSLTSGFEKFILSLAIRVALINVSNLPRPNFLCVDEGFGVMDADNLSTMNTLFSYLKSNFEFIIIVSHLDTLRDMVDNHIEIKKENGFSKVNFD